MNDDSERWYPIAPTVVLVIVCLVLGAAIGASVKTTVAVDVAHKELHERCCSCTQAELGRCGR